MQLFIMSNSILMPPNVMHVLTPISFQLNFHLDPYNSYFDPLRIAVRPTIFKMGLLNGEALPMDWGRELNA